MNITVEKIKVYLDKHPEYEKIAVLLSGDVGFYSGAKKLQETLKERKVRQISGLSSPILFYGEKSDAPGMMRLLPVHMGKKKIWWN